MHRPSESDGRDKFPCGIIINDKTQLVMLDRNQELKESIAELCQKFALPDSPESLSLWRTEESDNGTKHIDDTNKWRMHRGIILILKRSPEVTAMSLEIKIHSDAISVLPQLAEEAMDNVMLKCIYESQVLETIYTLLDKETSELFWIYGLRIIQRMIEQGHKISIPRNIMSSCRGNVSRINEISDDLLRESMLLLMLLRRKKRIMFPDDVYKQLESIIEITSDPTTLETALEFMVYIVIFPNSQEEEVKSMENIVNPRTVRLICNKILSQNLSTKMEQILYRYQTLILRESWKKKVVRVEKKDVPNFTVLNTQVQRGHKSSIKRSITDAHHLNERNIANKQLRNQDTVTHRNSALPLTYDAYKPLRNLDKVSYRNSALAQSAESLVAKNKDGDAKPVKKGKEKSSGSILGGAVRALSPTRKYGSKRDSKLYSCLSCSDVPDEVFETQDHLKTEFKFDGPIISRQSSFDVTAKFPLLYKSFSMSKFPTIAEEKTTVKVDSLKRPDYMSQLTIENIQYLSDYYSRLFSKWDLTRNNKHVLAEKITLMLCEVLEVGKESKIEDSGSKFHPLVIREFPCVIQELFCVAIEFYDKTGDEMQARLESDLPKVIGVMKDKFNYALERKPQSMDSFRQSIKDRSYKLIQETREKEREEKLEYDLKNKPVFLEYREKILPSIKSTINSALRRKMEKGDKFKKVNNKGDIIKDREITLTLFGNTLKILTEELDHGIGKSTSIEVPAFEIEKITYGKSTQIYDDIKKYQMGQDPFHHQRQPIDNELANRLISIRTVNGDFYDLVAQNPKTQEDWHDGFNILLGKPFESKQRVADLEDLLQMDVRIHFLDLEGLPLPDDPPLIPPPPTNFEFRTVRKTRRKKVKALS